MRTAANLREAGQAGGRDGRQRAAMPLRKRWPMPGDPFSGARLRLSPLVFSGFRASPTRAPSPAHELEIFLCALFELRNGSDRVTYCFLHSLTHCRAAPRTCHMRTSRRDRRSHAVTTQILLALARGGHGGGYSLTTHKIPSIVRVSNRSPAPAHSRALLPARLALQLLVYR